MSWISVGVTVASVAAKGISAHRAKKKAKKQNKASEKEIAAQTEAQSKELQKGVDQQVQAEKDLQHEYEGQSSISPETQYTRNQSERATSSAIDKAGRTGASAGEIMNMVSGLTARGQLQGQRISAAESQRRKEAQVAAKSQAVRAAQTGLAGKQAQIQLQDKGWAKTQNKQSMNNQAAAMNNAATQGMINDIGGMALYAGANVSNYFGKTPPMDGAVGDSAQGSDISSWFGSDPQTPAEVTPYNAWMGNVSKNGKR